MIVALLGGTIVLYQTQVLWDMTSPNAITWNATLNGTMTGFNIIPVFIIIIISAAVVGLVATTRGF